MVEMTVSINMQRSVTQEEMVAVAALKWIRELVENYRGSPDQLKAWLLKQLEEKETHADEILAAAYDNVL